MSARAFVSLFATVLLLTACAQTEGETCQIDDDCEGDLLCCKSAAAASVSDRGVCASEAVCESMRVDAGEPTDAGPGDSGPDGGPVILGPGQDCTRLNTLCDPARNLVCDRGVCLLSEDVDAGGEDAGGEADAGPEDAGSEDAGQDAGLDAGT